MYPWFTAYDEDIYGIRIPREIKLIGKNERLPIRKDVLFNLRNSLETNDLFNIIVAGKKIQRRIDFPFGYVFDEIRMRVVMEQQEQLSVHIFINNQLVKTWNIDGGII